MLSVLSDWAHGHGSAALTAMSEYDYRVKLGILVLAVPFVVWAWTAARCRFALSKGGDDVDAPMAPYSLPLIGHTIPFAIDTDKYVSALRRRFAQNPFKLLVGGQTMTVVPHGETLLSLFKNSRDLHSKTAVVESLRNSFGMPEEDLAVFVRDNTGIGLEPAAGAEPIDPLHRIFFQMHKTTASQLQGATLNAMTDHFLRRYAARIEARADVPRPGGEWLEVPDLYAFMRDDLFRAAIEAICGEHILRVSPDIVDNFWEFDRNLPTIFKRVPRWLVPDAWASRDRFREDVRRWHRYGADNFDWSDDDAVNAVWEPIYGGRINRERQQMYRNQGWSETGCAVLDVGLVWAVNANVIPSTFWTLLGVLKSDSLRDRVLAEVTPAFKPAPSLEFDVERLVSGKLMSSMYMESLRFNTATLIMRSPVVDRFRVGRWGFGRKDTLMAFSWYGHHDDEFWNQGRRVAGGKPQYEHPLDSWWAERFLEYPDDPASGPIRKPDPDVYAPAPAPAAAEKKEKASKKEEKTHEDDQHAKLVTTGIQGHWFPYGGGVKICPGRFFAKQEMMAGVAVMLRAFEIELADPTGAAADAVRPDKSRFPFGALPPDRPLAVRIRRRQL